MCGRQGAVLISTQMHASIMMQGAVHWPLTFVIGSDLSFILGPDLSLIFADHLVQLGPQGTDSHIVETKQQKQQKSRRQPLTSC